MSTKRRRIVDDDDGDGDDDDPGNANSTVMRILRHTKKTSSKSVKADKAEDAKGPVGIKRSTPIPRNDEIPKKVKVTDEKDGKPSLLTQSMLPLPPTSLLLQPPASSSVSSSATTGAAAVPVANTTGINDTARRHGKSITTTNNNNNRPPDMRGTRLSPVRMDSLDSAPQSQQQMQQQKSQQQQQQQQQSQLRDEERRVLNTLRNLCSKVHLKLLPTDDFLSGSFLTADGGVETILDQNAQGEIITMPRIPIFPEDFTQGQPLWPLSWWGIVDPLVENTETNDKATTTTTTKKLTVLGLSTKPTEGDVGVAVSGRKESTTVDKTESSKDGGFYDPPRDIDRRRSRGDGPDHKRRAGERERDDSERLGNLESERRHRGEGSFGEARRRGEERGGDGRRGGGDGRNETDHRRRGDGPPPNWENPPMDDRRGPWNDRYGGPRSSGDRGPPRRGPPSRRY